MINRITLLLFIGLAFWGCEEEQEVDTTPPSIEIISHTSGEKVYDTVNIMVTASDDNGIDRVEYFLNETLTFTDDESPYVYSWDTHLYENNANYSIKAISYDLEENSSESEVIILTTYNYDRFIAYHSVNDEGIGMSVFQHNNEYLIGSQVYNYSDDDNDFHVLKMDSSGNVIWHHEISNYGDDYLRALTRSNDGGILLAGTTHNGCQESKFNIVKKYNNSGNLDWSLCLGDFNSAGVFAITQASYNEYAALSVLHGAVTLCTFNDDGQTNWFRGIQNNTGGPLTGTTVTQINSGEFIIAGSTNNSQEFYVSKVGNDNTQSIKYYDGEDPVSSCSTSDGGFVLLIGYECKVIKMNNNCDIVWETNLLADQSGLLIGSFIIENIYGDYLITGRNQTSQSGVNGILSKVSNTGEFKWFRTYDFQNDIEINHLNETEDGGFVLTGYEDTGSNKKDIIVIKTDPDGKTADYGD
jgi:hypothetical protein